MTVMCNANTAKMRKTVMVNVSEARYGVKGRKSAYPSGKFAMA